MSDDDSVLDDDANEDDQTSDDDTATGHPMGDWLRRRLTGPKGREDWDRVVEATWDQCTKTPIRELMPPDAVQTLIEAHLDPDRLSEFVKPVVERILPHLVKKFRGDTLPLGRWVPDSARDSIESMASRTGLIHEDWIRALFRQRVVEAVMADTLYRGIREFSTIMPRMMLSLMPTQRFARLGGASAIGKRVVEELEKRIEPEIKTFLKAGTKRSLERAADFAVAHKEDDAALVFRRSVVHFVLSKSPSFHAHPLQPEVLEDLPPIVDQIARHVATRDETKELIGEAIAEFDEAWGEKPLGKVLVELGIEHNPNLKAWAQATWPSMVACIEAPDTKSWTDDLVKELLEEHMNRGKT